MAESLKYKLVAFDIDGTLVDDNKQLLPSSYSAIMQIQKMGVRVVVASGRPTYGCLQLANQLKLDQYGGFIVSYNGAKITSCADGQILVRRTIPLELLPKLKEEVQVAGLHLLTYTREHIITEEPLTEHVQVESWVNNGMEIKTVPSLEGFLTREPFKYAVVGDSDAIRGLKHRLEQVFVGQLEFFISHESFLEVVPVDVDKGNALDFLIEELGIPAKTTIAVGDNYNDLGMIERAGVGVAMANATEAVKRIADYVTTSNTENGIQHFINKYILYPEEPSGSVDLDALNAMTEGTLMGALGIVCTKIEDGVVEATMPVDRRTRQPMGILHGGASLALAETIAGYGSSFLLKPNEIQVGMQVSANHVKSAHEGDLVYARAEIIHRGRSSHVWDVNIFTETGQLVSTARVTNSILNRR